jgi:predicted dehydrogenase
VDAIYIGTPHNFHYENAKGALTGGKNVLCEKPFTIDMAELDHLFALAKKQNKLLME